MRKQVLFLIIGCCAGYLAFPQGPRAKVRVDPGLRDTFSFAKQWDYSWEVWKDDSTGEFSRNDDRPLEASDTAHLYFTARCTTNVQGGYGIRYCYAEKRKDELMLTLSDGMPAYASHFRFVVQGDSFSFQPQTIYPSPAAGETSYKILRQKLVLNQRDYSPGDVVLGWVDAEFLEIVTLPGKKSQSHRLFVRGPIRTVLQ